MLLKNGKSSISFQKCWHNSLDVSPFCALLKQYLRWTALAPVCWIRIENKFEHKKKKSREKYTECKMLHSAEMYYCYHESAVPRQPSPPYFTSTVKFTFGFESVFLF